MPRATNNNKRVFYATQAVAIGDMGATTVKDSWQASTGGTDFIGTGNLMIAHGLQSIGVTTNFNLEQIFELGQLSLYENYEEVPDIEVTFEKVLDGYTLMYHAGTPSAVSPTLTGRANARTDVRMAVGVDTNEYMASGVNSGVAELYCSGMYISSVSYTLGTDGNFTESTTFVGNNKDWITTTGTGGVLTSDANGALVAALSTGVFGSNAPGSPNNSVLRRNNLVIGSGFVALGSGTFRTEVPNLLDGGAAGTLTNSKYIGSTSGPYIQSISISCDLGRENIQQLGKKGPYYRYVSFPVDVTCDIEVTATGGDNVDALEEGDPSTGKNLSNHSIQLVLSDSTVFQLGKKNKLTSVSYGGGDAGGGNATITYSFTNSNDFVVLHSGDPMVMATSAYWKDWFA
jgi:hypothetical protein